MEHIATVTLTVISLLMIILVMLQGNRKKAKQQNSINEEEDDILGKIFISTIPWISYTALINPTPVPADSNPRITWGKYFMQNNKVLLPISVLCHHALIDGLHISKFYEFLDKEIITIIR